MIFKNNVVWLTWLKWGGINLKDEWEKKIKKKKKNSETYQNSDYNTTDFIKKISTQWIQQHR